MEHINETVNPATKISFVKWLKVLNAIKEAYPEYPKILLDILNKQEVPIKTNRIGNVKLEGYVQARYTSVKGIVTEISSYKDNNNIFTMHEACERFFEDVFFLRIAKTALSMIEEKPEVDDWKLCCDVEYVKIGANEPYAKFILQENLAKAVRIFNQV